MWTVRAAVGGAGLCTNDGSHLVRSAVHSDNADAQQMHKVVHAHLVEVEAAASVRAMMILDMML
jgi:hypothetical protein